MGKEKIWVTILGTGTSQGVPVIGCGCEVCQSKDTLDKRLRTSVLISRKNTHVVIDAGPDFRQQMLRHNVGRLDAVLITHNHKDHTGGIDDVRAYNWIQKKAMHLFARDLVLESIRNEFSYAFEEDKYPGAPNIRLREIDGKPFAVDNLCFTPIDATHHNMPVFGFRTGAFSYLTDANSIESGELDKMKGSRVVVINALRKEKHLTHFSLDEAVDILQTLQPEKGFITHISHQMGKHREINKGLPPGIELAFDGLRFCV